MIRRALIAVALTATTLVVLPAGPAQARPCGLDYSCTTTYYSDSAHTNAVGGKQEDCDGTTRTWGVRGPYLTFSERPCF
ncbi:hypothetical protein SAMN05444920_110155 [Nonomuraea solani]|uniref:Peptidase inhibitor family I36 n=1 Tax=Nonomuraea solani TaxID=1144553 RepID=A0A1H6EGM5_9ACTN|nr:DUF6289 family protein [Nonomuraea solani]SEG96922.1 hypothetical protein SAMN05444920_110155 [Nonomuraea solani]